MKKLRLLTAFLLFIYCNARSQSYFNRTYDLGGFDENGLSILVFPDTSYLFGGNAWTIMPYQENPLLLRLSKSGDPIWSKIIILEK